MSRAAQRAAQFRNRDAGRWAAGARSIAERFWEKVDKNGPVPAQSDLGRCWLWLAATNEKGYGKIGNLRAHRVSWELNFGPIPARAFVLHRCDNPGCVRAEHLELGAAKKNTADMFERSRNKHRSNLPLGSPKLTEQQIAIIRQVRASGKPIAHLAAEFGVATSTVYRIANSVRRDWWNT